MGPKYSQNIVDPSDHHTTIISVVAKIPPSNGNISLKFGHKTRLTFLHAEGNKKRGQNIDINLFFAFLKVLIL